MIPVHQWAASTPLTSLAPGKIGAEEIDGLERAVELGGDGEETSSLGSRTPMLNRIDYNVQLPYYRFAAEAAVVGRVPVSKELSLAASAYIRLALREGRSTPSATDAEQHAVNATRARPAHRVGSRLFDDVRLSKVRLAQRELEESTEFADRALSRAMAISSPQAIHRLRVHSQTLTAGYGDLAVVRAFSARLSEHLHRSDQKVSDTHA